MKPKRISVNCKDRKEAIGHKAFFAIDLRVTQGSRVGVNGKGAHLAKGSVWRRLYVKDR